MRIVEFSLENYKSYRKVGPLRLERGFNVVVGPNNAGKTALLEALTLQMAAHPHRSLATLPRASMPIDQVSRTSFTLAVTGQEVRDVLLNHTQFYVPVPSNHPNPTPELGQQHLGELLGRSLLELSLSSNGRGGFIFSYPPVLKDVPPSPRGSNEYLFYTFGTSTDKTSFQCQQITGLPTTHNSWFAVAQTLATSRLFAFRAERFALGESSFGWNPKIQGDARNLSEALHVMQTTQPAKFADLVKLTREVFPDIADISVRPKVGMPNMQEITLWNEEAARRRADLAFTLAESGTGIGQVLAMFHVVLEAEHSLVVIIDEPNSFLHPAASRKVIQILNDFPDNQYIISTHSPELIRATRPATLILLEKHGAETSVSQLDASNIADQNQCLTALGARLSDVFGADGVLWVEGATEEACYPELVRSARPSKGHEVLAILAVRSPSELQQSKKKKLELVLDIYRRLSTHNSLMPRTYGFLFDREGLSENEQADLTRLAGGLVHFLPYRMYENYLLVPDAIAATINSFPTMAACPIAGTDVANWINTNGTASDLVRSSSGTQSAVFTDAWLRGVHGARLLGKAFAHFTSNIETYDKVRHGFDLTNFILTHVPNHFGNLTKLIESVLKVAP